MLTNDSVPGLIFYYLPRGEKYLKFLAFSVFNTTVSKHRKN